MASPLILIVSPYAAAANNGNVRTAERWAKLLAPACSSIVRTPDDPLEAADLMIALHARRSHDAIRAWRERWPERPIVLTLTGTDLYHDIPLHDAAAVASLDMANALIVLQPRGIDALPERFRHKAHTVFQSAPELPAYAKSSRRLRVLFVGHLREEKDPFTFIRAATLLRERHEIEFTMIGGVRDPALAVPLRDLLSHARNVRMLGMLSHAATRERIRRSHLLVVPSRMEGGANVIVEAATSGTTILASDCDGNLGMLSADYPGLFAVRDHQGLAHLIARCRTEPAFLRHLRELCTARATLFTPEVESKTLRGLIEDLLSARR